MGPLRGAVAWCVAARALGEEAMPKWEEGMDDEIGIEAHARKIKLNIIVLTVTVLVVLSQGFEIGKERLLEYTSDDMLPIINSLFAELTLLGFIGVSLFLVFQIEWVSEISRALYGDASRIDELGEEVHMVLFLVMVLFLAQAVAMARMGEASRKKWQLWEARKTGHLSVKVEKAARDFLDAGWWELIAVQTYPRGLRALLYAATRESVAADRATASEESGLDESAFDFAHYLSVALGRTLADLVEVPVKTWLGLLVGLFTFFFLDYVMSNKIRIFLWTVFAYAALVFAFLIHGKLRFVLRYHLQDKIQQAIDAAHEMEQEIADSPTLHGRDSQGQGITDNPSSQGPLAKNTRDDRAPTSPTSSSDTSSRGDNRPLEPNPTLSELKPVAPIPEEAPLLQQDAPTFQTSFLDEQLSRRVFRGDEDEDAISTTATAAKTERTDGSECPDDDDDEDAPLSEGAAEDTVERCDDVGTSLPTTPGGPPGDEPPPGDEEKEGLQPCGPEDDVMSTTATAAKTEGSECESVAKKPPNTPAKKAPPYAKMPRSESIRIVMKQRKAAKEKQMKQDQERAEQIARDLAFSEEFPPEPNEHVIFWRAVGSSLAGAAEPVSSRFPKVGFFFKQARGAFGHVWSLCTVHIQWAKDRVREYGTLVLEWTEPRPDPTSRLPYASLFWFGADYKAQFTLDCIRVIPLFMSIYVAVFTLVYVPWIWRLASTPLEYCGFFLLLLVSYAPVVSLQIKLPHVVEDFAVAGHISDMINLRFIEQVLSHQKTIAAFQALRVVACLRHPKLVTSIMTAPQHDQPSGHDLELIDARHECESADLEGDDDALLDRLIAADSLERRRRKSWATTFQLFDEHHHGYIERDELYQMLLKFADDHDESEGHVEEIVKMLDSDNSGEVSFDEFYDFGKKLERYYATTGDRSQLVHEIFHMIDRDHGGLITIEELHQTIKSIGLDLSLNVVYGLVSDIDEDGNGALDAHEFGILMYRVNAFE